MSQDAGATWASLNGDITTNLLNGLAVSGQEIFAAIQDFSPVETFDGGNTWLQLSGSNSLGEPVGENGVVVINPGNADYQYIFNGVGLQYSTDGGHTFTNDPNFPPNEWTFTGSADRIAIDPPNPSTLYVAGNDGVFQSLDWGLTWKLLPWPFSNPYSVVVSPDGSIFVGTQNGAVSGTLNVSRDGGATWTVSKLPPNSYFAANALSVDPINPSIVLVGSGNTPDNAGGGVLISKDDGASFSYDNSGLATRSGGDGQYTYAFDLAFAPDSVSGVVVVATELGVYISLAGGSWTSITGNIVPQAITGIAWSDGYLYLATYGEGVVRAPIAQILSP